MLLGFVMRDRVTVDQAREKLPQCWRTEKLGVEFGCGSCDDG